MSTTTRSSAPVGQPRERPAVAARRWVLAFAAAWALPVLTHLLRVDWLLPPVLLLATVVLLRGGRTLLDRLVLAVCQLFGACCVAGLLISVWPWHLDPVPVAGCAFSALLVIAAAAGRRPALPRRVPPGDVLVWAASAAVALVTVVSFAVRDLGARVGLVATGEDMARHFLIFDMISHVGGYAFLQAAPPPGYGPGLKDYPQGAHLLYAVLDRFVRSADRPASGLAGMDVLLWCHAGTYVFLVLAVLWAARRVAGPGPTAATLLPIVAGVVGVLFFGDLITLFTRGYPNEMLGLALVAVLTAVLARPLAVHREQVVTVAALLIGVSFTYHLFLPYAFVAAAVWAWSARPALRRHPRILAAALLFLPLTLVTPVLNKPSGTGSLLLQPGTAFTADRPVLAVLVLVAVAGAVARAGRRSPARRMVLVELATAGAVALVLLVYQYAMVGHSVYYFEKLVHMLIVVALVGLGSAARLLPRVHLSGDDRWRRLTPGLAAGLAVTLVLAGSGGPYHAHPGSYGVRYALMVDRGSPHGGRYAVDLARAYPDGSDRVNVVLSSTPYANFYATLFGSAMLRDYQYGAAWYVFLEPTGPAHTIDDLAALVQRTPVPVRIFVRDPAASFLVVDRAHPDRPAAGPSAAAFGAPDAMTDVAAAEYLARRFPGKVEIVRHDP